MAKEEFAASAAAVDMEFARVMHKSSARRRAASFFAVQIWVATA